MRSIPETVDGSTSQPTDRRAEWVASRFDTAGNWIERVYRVGAHDVTLFVGHTFDAKRVYHHPELALLRGTQTSPAGVSRVGTASIPVHVLKTARAGSTGVAVYALLADGTFVENPVAYQLRASARLLVSGRRPMTLIMATDLAGDRDKLDEAPATKLLVAVLRTLQSTSAN